MVCNAKERPEMLADAGILGIRAVAGQSDGPGCGIDLHGVDARAADACPDEASIRFFDSYATRGPVGIPA